MKKLSCLSFAVGLTLCSPWALAAATQDEADRIKAALEKYIGSQPGIVMVSPDGDDYAITLDAAPLLAKITTPGFSATVTPWHLKATANGDGQWHISQAGAQALTLTIADAMAMEMKLADLSWNGVFDEGLGGFLSSKYSGSGMTVSQTINDPQSKIKTSTAYGIEAFSGESTATSRGDGVADQSGKFEFSGVTSVTATDLPPDAAAAGKPPLNYTANLASGSYATEAKGLRIRAILDLVAFLVAHPAKDLLIRDQIELKDKISAALPLFENLTSTGRFETVTIGTGFGQFQIASGGTGVALNGVVKDGAFGESITIAGLAIPPGLAPPWATGLLPSTIKFDFSVSGFDLEAPAKMLLAQVDLAKEPPIPPGSEALLLPAFAPGNALTVTLNPGEISSGLYALTYDGAIVANFAGMPTGKANIRMKGFEQVLAQIQTAAATDPVVRNGMAMLIAAKGMAKTEADGSLLWTIESGPAGAIFVNGFDISKLAGGP